VISETSTNQDDLAFLRNLLQGDSGTEMRRKFGVVYLLSGVVWAPYMLLQWLRAANLATISEAWAQRAWLIAMVVFAAAMIWGMWPTHRVSKTTSNRAFAAAFAGIGYSYLVLLAVLFNLTYQRQNGLFILIYAVVVFAGQGAGWYVAWMLQRQAWFGVVAIGWYAAALITGLSLLDMAYFLLACGVSMILFMAIPGFILMQKPRPKAIETHEPSSVA
jgi:hypothetical protein